MISVRMKADGVQKCDLSMSSFVAASLHTSRHTTFPLAEE